MHTSHLLPCPSHSQIAAYRASASFRAEPLHARYSHFHRGWVDGWARGAPSGEDGGADDDAPASPPTISVGPHSLAKTQVHELHRSPPSSTELL